jgi:hypothetical protein
MMIGRGDKDAPRLERIAVSGPTGGQRTKPAKHFRQQTLPVTQMQDDAHGGAKLARQTADQCLEGLDRTGGSANYDNASTFHAGSTGEKQFQSNAGKTDASFRIFPEKRSTQPGLGYVTLPITTRTVAVLS